MLRRHRAQQRIAGTQLQARLRRPRCARERTPGLGVGLKR
jgi:hypothetical protein